MSQVSLQRIAQLLQSGDAAAAEAELAALVAVQPDNADLLGLLGIALGQRQDYEGAAGVLGRAIALAPANPSLHANLGNALKRLKRFDDAAECFRRAIALRPDAPVAYRQLAGVLMEANRMPEAVDTLNREARLRPDHAPVYLDRARAARAMGNNPAALYDIENVLRLDPGNVEAFVLRAAVHRSLGKRGDALADCECVLALDPGHWGAHNNRGVLLDELGRSDEALASYTKALELNPDNPDSFMNIGTALAALGRGEDAVKTYDVVLEAEPDNIAVLNSKGAALVAMRRFVAALECFERAIACDPQSAISHIHRAFALLALGRLQEGFEAYEWRRRGVATFAELPRFAQPELKPGDDLRDKRLLLFSEQGIGDIIQFARFAPAFVQRGAEVVFATYPALQRLLASLGDGITVVPPEGPAPTFDVTCPLMSAPYVLGTALESIPARIPYLRAAPELRAAWRERLRPTAGTLKVGIAWSGNPQYTNDSTRSIAFSAFRDVLGVPGVTYINVQKDVRVGDEDALVQSGAVDFRPGLTDFAETAALVCELDVVIAVDTSLAHLAGALGKPVWILLSAVSDWRWFEGRADSPWYPTARLFRQSRIGAWEPVFAEVRAALAERVLRQ